MNCHYCKDTGWFLYKEDAPSPPYKRGQQLEFVKRCVCRGGFQQTNQNFEDSQD